MISGPIRPRPAPPIDSRPVVLGTDFTAVSAGAEAAAIEAAAAAGVDLVVVHAIDPGRLRLPGGAWRQRLDQVRAAREHDAAGLVERARTAGVAARSLIWTGDPATCVLEAARAEDAQRIVVGSHGRGRIARAIAGSVSDDVATRARCPVVVIAADRG